MKRSIILACAILFSCFILFGCATAPRSGETEGHGTRDLGEERRERTAPARTAYELREVDRPPRIITKIDPLYPSAAKEQGIHGRVTLRFIVTKDGKVVEPTVVSAEPSDVFNDSAVEAISRWRFRPAIKDGEPVDVIILAPLNFELVEDDSTKEKHRPSSNDNMVGTWKLVYAKWNGVDSREPKRLLMLSHVTSSHGAWMWINPANGQVVTVAGGREDPKKGFYRPTYGFGREYETFRDNRSYLTDRIEGDRLYRTGSLSTGFTIEEVWERVTSRQQETDQTLVGTWKMVNAKWDGRENDAPKRMTILRLITPTHSTRLSINRDNQVVAMAGGTYSLTHDTYNEIAAYGFGSDFEMIRDRGRSFNSRIEGNRWYHSGRSANGFTVEEIWERVDDD